jgi:arylsulfatase A-like enzyme
MKKLGIYDSATIIITADHGQRAESDAETGKIIEMSSPIMLVKKPFDSNNELVINYNPVSQNELFPTLLEAAGLDYSEYGKTFDEVGEDDNKIREYVDIYMDSTVIYSIKGNVKNIDSWSIVE